jgi:hypothetical protein
MEAAPALTTKKNTFRAEVVELGVQVEMFQEAVAKHISVSMGKIRGALKRS